jgi:hypothetical protein
MRNSKLKRKNLKNSTIIKQLQEKGKKYKSLNYLTIISENSFLICINKEFRKIFIDKLDVSPRYNGETKTKQTFILLKNYIRLLYTSKKSIEELEKKFNKQEFYFYHKILFLLKELNQIN